MIQRVRQFFRAIRAHLSEADYLYIGTYLSEVEQKLFFGMHVADQYHAVQVAHTAERLADRSEVPVERELLIRSALLHDVGRCRGDMDIWGKVLAVLLKACFPRRSKKWARKDAHGLWGRITYMLFVYYHHPEIGAEKLRGLGLMQEAELAEKHHLPEAKDDALELCLLRQADELN